VRAEHRFERAPARVYWELTRACDLACRHCRAEALSEREPDELTTEECRRVLGRLAAVGPPLPHVVFTGGDPLKRPDLLELVRSAVGLGLGASVAPSATHALSAEAVDALREALRRAVASQMMGDVPDELLGRAFVATKKLIPSIKQALGADFVAVSVVGVDVPHFHIHLIPRRHDDGLADFWPTKKYQAGEAEKIVEQIKAAL